MSDRQNYLHELLFTPHQIEAIRCNLNIEKGTQLESAITSINGACSYYRWIRHNRHKVPDLRSARENLSAVLHHAKNLRGALRIAPLGMHYTRFNGHADLIDRSKAEKVGSEQLALDTTIAMLTGIIKQAKILEDNEDGLRSLYLLPELAKKNTNLETIYLWPSLFDIYEDIRGRLTYSPDGPLVRYVATVHDALGIDAPSSATIRTSVPTWRAKRDLEG